VDRSPALRSTLATVSHRDSGLVVRITGADAVREPVMRLIVELESNGSRVRRSYDLLLDPSPSPPLEPPVRRPEAPPALKPLAKPAPKPSLQSPAARPEKPAMRPGFSRPALESPARDLAEAGIEPAPPPQAVVADHRPFAPSSAGTLPRFQMTWALSRVPRPEEMVRPAPEPSPASASPSSVAVSSEPAPSTAAGASAAPPENSPLRTFALYGWAAALILAFLAWMRARQPVPRPVPAEEIPASDRPSRQRALDEPPRLSELLDEDVPRPTWPPAPASSRAPASPEPESTSAASAHEPTDFYDGMGRLLAEHVERDPSRPDMWLKLLEVAHADGNAAEFVENVESMIVHVGRNPKVWDHVVEMGKRLAPQHPLFAQAAAESPPPKRRFYDTLEPAVLRQALEPVEAARRRFLRDPTFMADLAEILAEHAHRPTPLDFLRELSDVNGGAAIHAKREDLAPKDTELQMIVYGQVALAKALGRKRVVAGTVDGRLGQVVAQAAAAIGVKSMIFVSRHLYDQRVHPAMKVMTHAGADIVGSDLQGAEFQRLALLQAVQDPVDTFYVSGLGAGPAPYPALVRGFQSIIGDEVRRQSKRAIDRDPDVVIAHVRSGLGTLGLMHPLLDVQGIRLECVESGGLSIGPRPGDLAREHSWLRALGRVSYRPIDDLLVDDARDTIALLPDLHVEGFNVQTLARALVVARGMRTDQSLVVLFSSTVNEGDAVAGVPKVDWPDPWEHTPP
jgi:tryptophan synthase beta chain